MHVKSNFAAIDGKKRSVFYATIDGNTDPTNWHLEIMRQLENGGFEKVLEGDYKGLYHAVSAMRKFRKGLKWAKQ